MELRISIVIYFNFFKDLWHAHLTGFCFSSFYYVITNVTKTSSFLDWTLETCMRLKRLCLCLEIFFWMGWCYSFFCSNGKVFASPGISSLELSDSHIGLFLRYLHSFFYLLCLDLGLFFFTCMLGALDCALFLLYFLYVPRLWVGVGCDFDWDVLGSLFWAHLELYMSIILSTS